jgi:ribosome maturation factor RimP
MNDKKTVALARDLAKPIADGLGLTIWDVVYEKEGAYWYLRVFIDKEDAPVGMDDCEKMSRPLSVALDEADPIADSYILEVGSPGIERKLKRKEHFDKYIGKDVKIRYIRKTDGVKEFSATLEAYRQGVLTVSIDDGDPFDVNIRDTAFVKLEADCGEGFGQ